MMKKSIEYHSENIDKICLSPKQAERFYRFILGDDMDFYEEYVIYETPEEQEMFFKDNPGFMAEYPISHERIGLLRDKMFRNILRMVKKHENEKNKKTPS